MKLCKECKHCFSQSVVGSGIAADIEYCYQQKWTFLSVTSAKFMRSEDGECGPEGRLWDEKR